MPSLVLWLIPFHSIPFLAHSWLTLSAWDFLPTPNRAGTPDSLLSLLSLPPLLSLVPLFSASSSVLPCLPLLLPACLPTLSALEFSCKTFFLLYGFSLVSLVWSAFHFTCPSLGLEFALPMPAFGLALHCMCVTCLCMPSCHAHACIACLEPTWNYKQACLPLGQTGTQPLARDCTFVPLPSPPSKLPAYHPFAGFKLHCLPALPALPLPHLCLWSTTIFSAPMLSLSVCGDIWPAAMLLLPLGVSCVPSTFLELGLAFVCVWPLLAGTRVTHLQPFPPVCVTACILQHAFCVASHTWVWGQGLCLLPACPFKTWDSPHVSDRQTDVGTFSTYYPFYHHHHLLSPLIFYSSITWVFCAAHCLAACLPGPSSLLPTSRFWFACLVCPFFPLLPATFFSHPFKDALPACLPVCVCGLPCCAIPPFLPWCHFQVRLGSAPRFLPARALHPMQVSCRFLLFLLFPCPPVPALCIFVPSFAMPSTTCHAACCRAGTWTLPLCLPFPMGSLGCLSAGLPATPACLHAFLLQLYLITIISYACASLPNLLLPITSSPSSPHATTTIPPVYLGHSLCPYAFFLYTYI